MASPLSVTEMMMPAIQVTAMVEENLRRPDFTWVYLVVGCCGGIGLAWLCIDLLRQMLVERRITANASRHRRVGRATVILSSMVASSFTTGFFRPRIYLPPHLADDPVSRGVVLKHEFAHVRRGHLIWAFIEMAYQRLFWFNPLSHFLFHDGRFVRELACDEAAARRCTPVTYAQVLVLQAEWLLSHRGFVLVNPLHESEKTLKRRVTYLLEEKMKKTTLLSISAVVLSLGVCSSVYFIVGCNGSGGNSPLAPSISDATVLEESAVAQQTDTIPTEIVPVPVPAMAKKTSAVHPPAFTRGGALTGARSRESILRVIMQNISVLRYAYNDRLGEQPGLKGTITVKFAMDEKGVIIFCEKVNSTVNDPTLENAVVERIKTWQFEPIDKPGDVTEVVYPFTFSQ